MDQGPEIFDPTEPGENITTYMQNQRRRTAARREKLMLQVQLSQILEPRTGDTDGDDPRIMGWSERQYIEERIAELQQIIEEDV